VSTLPKCIGGRDCITVGYSIITNPNAPYEEYAYVNDIMKNFAKENSLEFNTDVKLLSVGGPDMFNDYLENN
jgi:hypothetical protein